MIGIMLRDLLPTDQSQVEFAFGDVFAKSLLPTLTDETIVNIGDQMVLNKEVVCMMPVSMLSELPKPKTDYLSELREEWFVLFDRLAEYQHPDSDVFEEVSEILVWSKRKNISRASMRRRAKSTEFII